MRASRASNTMKIYRRCLTDRLASFQLVNRRNIGYSDIEAIRQKTSWCSMSTDDSKLSILMIANPMRLHMMVLTDTLALF